jgi:capsular polysaccharide biosynthesis protein
MELRRYLRLIRQRLILVILCVIVGLGAGYVITTRTPTFTATAVLYVGPTDFTGVANQDQLFVEGDLTEITDTFATMLSSPVIAQKAIDRTHLIRYSGEVAANTVATVVASTQLIDVSVTDVTADDAVDLVNAVANSFVSQIEAFQANPTSNKNSIPNEPAHVFQNAIAAVRQSDQLVKHMLLGGIFGLIVAIFAVLLLDYLDITIKDPDELERRIGLPVLGIIPRFDNLQLDRAPGGVTRATPGVANG